MDRERLAVLKTQVWITKKAEEASGEIILSKGMLNVS
jgi:hypothetical protein